jgi:hypothetical protein
MFEPRAHTRYMVDGDEEKPSNDSQRGHPKTPDNETRHEGC